ncbi:peptide chain release factor N(5)-glutamine methyltransferase [uncultured Maricaulis sp.]|uniref:peptide chain release factor N(5)-glutamine methyltransferase n=1 Tax=uncultured Maricaulis sp. TaxID=174710 RepID=UPI0030DB43B9|tara:strand:+ start:11383 stop:12330 length:948 start_codon:yes stop_codon:yes gene_type:complete
MPSTPFEAAVQSNAAEQAKRPGFPLVQAWQGMELGTIRRHLVAALGSVGIDEAEDDARFLIADVLAPVSLAQALADPALWSWQAAARLADLAALRLERVPLSQVLGSKPFWTLDLKVTRDVLTPRADTEALVEAVLERCDHTPHHMLDLGTGSGAILAALLSERPGWTGQGVDLSPAALAVAKGNLEACELTRRATLVQGRWGDGLGDHGFDLIVSNPPYIASDVLAGLEPEVRDHEPALALDGGEDGLDAYRVIIADLPRLLRPGGSFALEIGFDQAAAVMALVQAAGLSALECLPDLAGHDRVVFGRAGSGNG